MHDVVLGLFDKLVVDDGPELLTEGSVACNALEDRCKLLSGLLSHVFFVGDF